MKVRFALTALLFLFPAQVGWAQQLIVRSGEHGSFSRLVIPYPQGTVWKVDQGPEGIVLAPEGTTFQYDVAEVFRFIPKGRITAVRTQVGTSDLIIETSGTVHPKSFQLLEWGRRA
ncbi:hypothetical protein [Paenirhodobacter sp.]|uniref:hypothetical protein n=1 Tax=Paenirhodobacter sp. TaxID=1965326 RepID=UPI003B416445